MPTVVTEHLRKRGKSALLILVEAAVKWSLCLRQTRQCSAHAAERVGPPPHPFHGVGGPALFVPCLHPLAALLHQGLQRRFVGRPVFFLIRGELQTLPERGEARRNPPVTPAATILLRCRARPAFRFPLDLLGKGGRRAGDRDCDRSNQHCIAHDDLL
jgi:hypothetical protein